MLDPPESQTMLLSNYRATLVLSLYIITLCTSIYGQNRFIPRKICAANGSLEKQPYAQADPSVTTVIGCVLTCHNARTQGVPCVGAGLDKGGVCYTLRPSDKETTNQACLEDETIKVFVVEESCENGGVWEGLRGRCQCSGGWVGERCHRYAHNCSELRSNGYEVHKSYFVKLDIPDSGITPRVHCGLWRNNLDHTYLFRNFGRYSNNRKYVDYVNGFTHDDRSYFIGLKHMHALTHNGKRIKMNLYVKRTLYYEWYIRQYDGFKVADASTGYTFNFQNVREPTRYGTLQYNLKFGDCLGPAQGIPFSTVDHDKDASRSVNCAARAKAGWWFRDYPFLCNPLGLKPSLESLDNLDSMVKVAGMEMTEPPLVSDFLQIFMIIEEVYN